MVSKWEKAEEVGILQVDGADEVEVGGDQVVVDVIGRQRVRLDVKCLVDGSER